MKRNMIRLTLGLAAMCVVVMGLESQADARLFGRGGRGSFGGWGGRNHHNGCHSHHNGGCCEQQTSCCEEQVHHNCGGCQSDCHSDCGCNGHHGGRRGLFGRRHHRHHGGGCGCDSGCGSGCGCNGNGGFSGGGEVIIDGGVSPSPATNGPAPAAPEAPPETNGQEAPSA